MTERPEETAGAPDTPREDDEGSPPTSRGGAMDGTTPADGAVAMAMDTPTEPKIQVALPISIDPEVTVNLAGDAFELPLRDDMRSHLAESQEAEAAHEEEEPSDEPPRGEVSREHLKGLLEALVFASDKPIKPTDLAKSAAAPLKEVKLLLAVLKTDYAQRGVQLDEVAGGWIFRTNAAFAPFVRDLTKQKPVRLTRAQIETLAILAYRQPITRPEVDEIRGVDCGAVLKLLLERDLVKILGKKDEPGRPLLYGTTPQFLEFFGLGSLRDLPTLREFTELNEDSRRVVERELGDVLATAQGGGAENGTTAESLVTEVDEATREISAARIEELEGRSEDEAREPEADAPPPAAAPSAYDPKDEDEFPDDDDDAFDDDDDDEDDEDEDEDE